MPLLPYVCIWTGTDRKLDQLLNYLNKIDNQIQFAIEKGKENYNKIIRDTKFQYL